jgi:hypothetical protein
LVGGGLFIRIFAVPPGQAGVDHGQAEVLPLANQLADEAAVAIALVPVDGDRLPPGQGGQALLGLGAEGLGLLGGVDTAEADPLGR